MSIHNNIRYIFGFKNGETKEFLLRFDESNLDLLPIDDSLPPSWAKQSLHTCNGCPLDPAVHPYCPTALHLGSILRELQGRDSFEEVTIQVIDDTRSYIKETSLQDGLGSLMGIVMPTGGCPLLKPLRPMVRFHLPFTSLEEMEYRMVSMYLFAQYLRLQNGEEPDWALEGLKEIYKGVSDVNNSFACRVSSASNSDAGKNAIIILDCFAKTVPKAIQNMMKDFRVIFASHLGS
jgi:hypothetical protein